MPNVMLATRQALADTMTTVSATTQTITHGATALSDLSAAGAAHAHNYRLTTERELALSRDEFDDIATDRAKLRIARARFQLDQELGRKDAKSLVEHFDSIEIIPDAQPSTPALHAAE